MSTLAVDAGNTRIKWGLHDGGRWVQQSAIPTAEAERFMTEIAGCPNVDRAVIANVAGEGVAQIISAALAAYNITPSWVEGRREQCGVRSSYADPGELGPDRWAALIGARSLCPGACVVVNAGTTMTVDALSGESIFLGGFIVPGYALMRQALATHTARLTLREGVFSFFPDNTGDAIASGALNALAGAVERMCRHVVQAGEDEPVVILSGGNAALLAPRLDPAPVVAEHLVLEGLLRIGASGV